MRAEVVDLFCGIGGLSAGFQHKGFTVLAGLDSDASCRFAFESNIKSRFIKVDVTAVRGKTLRKLYTKHAIKILIGCAPCQPFSIYTGRYRRKTAVARTDERWALLQDFARLIEEIKPEIVSMENVPRLTLHPVFASFVERLRKAGYQVSYQKIRADHYGVPQRRTRLVLFASKFGPVRMIAPTQRHRPKTVRDAISSLPPIAAGEAHPRDRLHRSRGLRPKNLERIRATGEGGSWQDWNESLKLACHKRDAGQSFRTVYGRMNWDEPAPVITTQCLGIGNGRFGHPEQDRAISLREAALLQTFPRTFKLLPPRAKFNGLELSRQIGNAVPIKLGEAIAESVRVHLNEAFPPSRRVARSRRATRPAGKTRRK